VALRKKSVSAGLKVWTVAELGAFYTEHRSELHAHAARILKDNARAEEVTQDALIKVMLAAPELESADHALSYLHRTIENLCIDIFRIEGRRPNLVLLDEVAAEVEKNWQENPDHSDAIAAADDAAIETAAAKILADVQARGDTAVLEYTQQFDRLSKDQASSVKALEISKADLMAALNALPAEQRSALEAAAERVKSYHERQKVESGCHSWDYADENGTRLGQKVTPLDRAGLYVPGGKAAYPSSVLMNAIPAKVAGVSEVIMVVPTPDGVRNPLVLAAAAVAGVD